MRFLPPRPARTQFRGGFLRPSIDVKLAAVSIAAELDVDLECLLYPYGDNRPYFW